MTAPTLILPGGPAHQDDPRAWTIPPTTPDVHAWREQQHARRGGFVASMRLRNAQRDALEQAHRAAQGEPTATRTPKAPSRPRNINPRAREWAARYQAGESTVTIARSEGVTPGAVSYQLRKQGVAMRPASPLRVIPPDQAAAMRAEYEAGATLHAVAEKYRCHSTRARDAIVGAGGALRPSILPRRKGKA